MVTLTAETGAGLADANTYVGLSEANTYFASHPFYADSWGLLDTDTQNLLLAAATRQLDVEYQWYGYRATTAQALEWPRYGVRDQNELLIPQTTIPTRLRQAVCEQAYYLTKGDKTVEAVNDPGLDKLKIDVIELDFNKAIRTTSVQTVPTAVRTLLRGLGDHAGSSRVRKVIVG